MLTSLAATQAPEAATEARTRTSPAICSARSSKDRKNGKSVRIVPVVHAATISDWPAATLVVDSTAAGATDPERGQRRCAVVQGQVPAGQRHVVPAAGLLHAAQGLAGELGDCRRWCRRWPAERRPSRPGR